MAPADPPSTEAEASRLIGYREAVTRYGITKATFHRLAVPTPGGGRRVARSVLERLCRQAGAAGPGAASPPPGRRRVRWMAVPDYLS